MSRTIQMLEICGADVIQQFLWRFMMIEKQRLEGTDFDLAARLDLRMCPPVDIL